MSVLRNESHPRRTAKSVLGLICMMILVAGLLTPARSEGAPISRTLASTPEEIAMDASELEEFDISNTPEGEEIAEEVSAKWERRYETEVASGTLEVYEFGSEKEPDIVVAPPGTVDKVSTTENRDGSMTMSVEGEFQDMDDVPDANDDLQPLGGSTSWKLKASNCWARNENNTGWIDHCFKMHKLVNDGNPNKSFFSLEHFATAKSKGVWTLLSARIESWKHPEGPTLEWLDWAPRSDITDVDSCRTQGFGISAAGFGISSSATLCPDRWNINKYVGAGHFENEWRGKKRQSEREVGYIVGVKTNQGKSARFRFEMSFDCSIL